MRANEFINEGKNGPHSGREIQMLLNGTKPAALLSPTQMLELKPYIKSHKFTMIPQAYTKCWIVGQKGEENRIQRIYNLLKNFHEKAEELGYGELGKLPNTMYHIELGRLFGYDEDDINYHLNYGELRRQRDADIRAERIKEINTIRGNN